MGGLASVAGGVDTGSVVGTFVGGTVAAIDVVAAAIVGVDGVTAEVAASDGSDDPAQEASTTAARPSSARRRPIALEPAALTRWFMHTPLAPAWSARVPRHPHLGLHRRDARVPGTRARRPDAAGTTRGRVPGAQ